MAVLPKRSIHQRLYIWTSVTLLRILHGLIGVLINFDHHLFIIDLNFKMFLKLYRTKNMLYVVWINEVRLIFSSVDKHPPIEF